MDKYTDIDDKLPCEIVLLYENKRQEYIQAYINGRQLVPTFEAVVRSTLSYPRPVKGNSTETDYQNESHVSKEKLNYIYQLYGLLNACHCDIWNLAKFVAYEELIYYYYILEINSQQLKLSQEETSKCIFRKCISIILSEVNRLKLQRYSLQKSLTPMRNSEIASAYDYLSQIINTSLQNQTKNDMQCLCYCCFILGYYSYYTLDWNKALFFWNLSNFEEYKWDVDTILLYLQIIKQPYQNNTPPKVPFLFQINYNELPTKPYVSKPLLEAHHCITPQETTISSFQLNQNIQYHLNLWNKKTSYFINPMVLQNDQTGYTCLMTSLYLYGAISEVIALNQYYSFCNYSDVKMMLKDKDIDDELIQFYSDIPLLQVLINIYSQRAEISQTAARI